MKKQLTVALGLAVLATPAFASKARLQALGEDIYGSFYINDNRNIFLNAAQLNNHKDLVTFEWGDTTAASDSVATPRAEGGLYKSHGNLVYGLHLGSESNSANGFRAASLVSAQEENNIDIFVAGDAGVKWGANVTYSKSADDESAGDSNQEALRTRFGVIAGDIEAYANINISNKAEAATQAGDAEFKGKLGYQVGAIYNLNDYRIFADWRSLEGEADGVLDGDIKAQQLQVGAGRATRLNDKATLFTKAQFQWNKTENDTAIAGNFGVIDPDLDGDGDPTTGTLFACNGSSNLFCEEYKAMSVPVVIGLEYDAASWLVLRASVGQTIWGKEEDKKDERPFHNTTAVNAGATLKFGELSVDGVIGNGTAGATTGTLNTDTLMSRVGMTYRF